MHKIDWATLLKDFKNIKNSYRLFIELKMTIKLSYYLPGFQ